MAVAEAWDKVTVFVYSQLYDERKRAQNNVSAPHLTPFFFVALRLNLDLVLTIHGSESSRL
jgi:hypothetical protein